MLYFGFFRIQACLVLDAGRDIRRLIFGKGQIYVGHLELDGVFNERVRDHELDRVGATHLTEVLGVCAKVNLGRVLFSGRWQSEKNNVAASFDVREANKHLMGLDELAGLEFIFQIEFQIEFRLLIRFQATL
jgi:hypothetical protein